MRGVSLLCKTTSILRVVHYVNSLEKKLDRANLKRIEEGEDKLDFRMLLSIRLIS